MFHSSSHLPQYQQGCWTAAFSSEQNKLMYIQQQLRCSGLILSVVDYKLALGLYLVIFVINLIQVLRSHEE